MAEHKKIFFFQRKCNCTEACKSQAKNFCQESLIKKFHNQKNKNKSFIIKFFAFVVPTTFFVWLFDIMSHVVRKFSLKKKTKILSSFIYIIRNIRKICIRIFAFIWHFCVKRCAQYSIHIWFEVNLKDHSLYLWDLRQNITMKSIKNQFEKLHFQTKTTS